VYRRLYALQLASLIVLVVVTVLAVHLLGWWAVPFVSGFAFVFAWQQLHSNTPPDA
jgi:antibiotic biosynthesis monooxygenase (ABM) superfamily enzyme